MLRLLRTAWRVSWGLSLASGLVLVALSPAPSLAADPPSEGPVPAISYRVVNVSSDDTLNVRAQPGTQGEVVATLAHDADGVMVTGLRRRVGTAMWWEVAQSHPDGDSGWVHSAFIAAEDVEPEADFPLRCGGTEPFWSLALSPGEAEFELMGEGPEGWDASAWMNAAGLLPGYRFAVRLERQSPAGTGWAAISQPRTYCTDHMSDNLYPYDLILVTPDSDIYAGCCSRAP